MKDIGENEASARPHPNEELNYLLGNLPFWGLTKVEVIPLQGFEDQAKQVRDRLEQQQARCTATVGDTLEPAQK